MLKSLGDIPRDVPRPQKQDTVFPQEDPLPYHDASAHSMLDGDLAPLVQAVSDFMTSEADRDAVPVRKVTVYGHASADDGTRQLVITQFVDLPTAEALAYRRRLFKAFGAWAQTLSQPRRSLLNNLVINVRWKTDAAADQS